jgi:beta-glucosidase/6-phospho-beta-glucosidase/beta-galactosidase
VVKYERLFDSFFMGGFECSTHRLRNGKRLDEVSQSHHDRFVAADYHRLKTIGMRAAREGIRWHLIEARKGEYDFSSLVPMLRAAKTEGIQVIWDLFHYGWPDWLDIFSPEFVDAFARLAKRFAEVVAEQTDEVPFVSPVNEISFFSWAAGQVGYMNPFAEGRGDELKDQLVRASLAATNAVWAVNPRTRIAQIDPVINVLAEDPNDADQVRAAEAYRLSQFDAWDMLGGRLKPHLGGAPKYLDIIGVNYYVHNQWILGGSFVEPTNPRYRPFRKIVKDVGDRYQRPLFIAETGIEDEERPKWFRYVASEVREAMRNGTQVEGICLYPILNHPGWDDDRHCHNGLWDYADESGYRPIYEPLAEELRFQQNEFESMESLMDNPTSKVHMGQKATTIDGGND